MSNQTDLLNQIKAGAVSLQEAAPQIRSLQLAVPGPIRSPEKSSYEIATGDVDWTSPENSVEEFEVWAPAILGWEAYRSLRALVFADVLEGSQ